MIFEYAKLEGKIIEKCKTKKAFAQQLNISMNSLTNKLSGKKYFKQQEIEKSMRILNIVPEELYIYFFTLKVEKN